MQCKKRQHNVENTAPNFLQTIGNGVIERLQNGNGQAICKIGRSQVLLYSSALWAKTTLSLEMQRTPYKE